MQTKKNHGQKYNTCHNHVEKGHTNKLPCECNCTKKLICAYVRNCTDTKHKSIRKLTLCKTNLTKRNLL